MSPLIYKKLPLSLAITSALMAQNALADDAVIDTQAIEKIVIIGEKAPKSLKDTSSSVAVLSEEVLNSTQYKSITEAVSEIPNVVAVAGSLPDIRGVSGNGSAGGFNSISGGAKGRVSILVDGVAQPFVADNSGDMGLWDMEQMEIYRGPQSTSNGRNSMAGAIYIKTKDPTEDWHGAARLGYRNQDSYIDTSVALSGPLVTDTLSFRISAQQLNGNTITDDSGYEGNSPDYDLDKVKSSHVRTKLKWTPTDKLSMLLSYSDSNEKGDVGRVYYKADDLSKFNRLYFRDIKTRVKTTSLKTDYAFNDDLRLEVLTAYMDYHWGFDSYDETEAEKQVLAFDEDNYTVDAKLSFNQRGDAMFGFIGVDYFKREHDILSVGSAAYNGDDSSDSLAAYGEITFSLTDKLSLLTGARLERESQTRHFIYGAIDAGLDKDTDVFLPKLELQYAMTDATTLALSARKGYNAAGGALNFTAQDYYYYDEEKVMTYELSSRSALLDGAVFLTANLFYNDYDGFQSLNTERYIINMDDVVTYGAEVGINADVTDSLQVNAGAGWLHSDIKDAGADYQSANGNELNNAPKFTGNLGVTYWLTNELSTSASANYVGEYYGDFANTAGNKAGDYTLVRLQASYKTADWQINAFVNNAFDKMAVLSRTAAGGRYPTGYASVADPRNVGVSVTYSF
ncbi:TonB-dependent receptor [Shewanella mangrovi]|uniref:TonB-dependent receptor n=1 Tax=Shewanella mangrovi TaxID=1515746 RepID=A0A094JMK8_9GAMM|nr:TonB-dependent receptor [Shewanella mangrovi]KFZ39289.1 TonB-dependent receptor [Shewanella mangrovi]